MAFAHRSAELLDHARSFRRGPEGLKELSTRHRTILSMEMRGHDKREIAEALQLNYGYVCQVTRSKRYLNARNTQLNEADNAFINLGPKAIEALGDGLGKSSNMSDRLKAADLWFRTRGYGAFAKEPSTNGPVTAEDVVKQLLQVNLQVNLNTKDSSDNIILEAAE